MDEELRNLKRRAASGDIQAAINYAQYLLRTGEIIKPEKKVEFHKSMDERRFALSIQRSRISGTLFIYPVNLHEVTLRQISRPNQFGGESEDVTTIFTVDYIFSGRYYYYPEIGWVPYDPDTVAHAREHFENYDASMRKQEVTVGRDWTFYLPAPEHEGKKCFSCGEEKSQAQFRLRRANRDLAGAKACRALDSILRAEVGKWANANQGVLQEAHLNQLQHNKQRAVREINELAEKLSEARHKLGELIIEELQIEPE